MLANIILATHRIGKNCYCYSTARDPREYEELNDVLGLLATWLLIKAKFLPNSRFIEVLAAVAGRLENATEWQDSFVPEAVGTGGLIAFPISFIFNNISVHNYDNIDVKFT